MTDFEKMDAFFTITSFVVVIIGVISGLILYRIWQILGHVQRFAQILEREAELVRRDVAHLRENVGKKGFRLKYFVRFFKGALGEFFRSSDD